MTHNKLEELFAYAVRIRRQLHKYPEVGFELPRTVALVQGELEAMGIETTNRYGTCSVVAEIGQGEQCLAIRADMDALPVQEKTGLPYSSEIPGQMHACGHDAHTAVVLALAKYLKEQEKKLPCRVRFLFQPSEEGAVSGAKMMVEQGVMDGVDRVICTHCENAMDAGCVGICGGDYMAACIPTTIRFLGRTAHAALAHEGVDAIAMAAEAYGKLREMVEQEAAGRRYIWSVGRFQGGHVHNVVADRCELDISFRFYDMDFAKTVEEKTRKICQAIAEARGGSVEIDWHMSTGAVYNNEDMTEVFARRAAAAGIPVNRMPMRMSSEDFGWYLTKAPGMIFRFGTRNEALGCTALAHRNDFQIDETGMRTAIAAFAAFVLQEDAE